MLELIFMRRNTAYFCSNSTLYHQVRAWVLRVVWQERKAMRRGLSLLQMHSQMLIIDRGTDGRRKEGRKEGKVVMLSSLSSPRQDMT